MKCSRTKVNFKIRNHRKRQIRRTKILPKIAWRSIENDGVWKWRTIFCYCLYFNCRFIRCFRWLLFCYFKKLVFVNFEAIRIWSSFYMQKRINNFPGIPIILYFWENIRWFSMNELSFNERFYATLTTFFIIFSIRYWL